MKPQHILFLLFVSAFHFIIPPAGRCQIVADHTIVDDYQKIPVQYIAEIKKMWVILAGESHSKGYRIGCSLLEELDPEFSVSVTESGTPEGYTDLHLRLSRATWGDLQNPGGWIYTYGEEDWFTSSEALTATRSHLTYCNTHSLSIAAMGFGWCWDMTANNWPGGEPDPEFRVRWAGRTDGGPDGSLRWGLNAGDQLLTGNSVCMDTYLNATLDYIDYCQQNGYPTRLFFTTGPVDGSGNTGENGFQRSIKHQYIRDFVSASPGRMLFDYADILCWSDSGEQETTAWTDFTGNPQQYQVIHPDNLLDLDGTYTEDGDHIGQRGALRLGKALWWMLARMAGWDGVSLGMNPAESVKPVKIYPNPASGCLTVETGIVSGSTISIYSMLGQPLLRNHLQDSCTRLDISMLPDGIYFVRLNSGNWVQSSRFVKF